nr:PREDICTED: uncharacterized protein LOC108212387 isoform X2 [Daucus carota subsp. sativus]
MERTSETPGDDESYHGWRIDKFDFESPVVSGTPVKALKVDRTGLAAACGQCSSSMPCRTPLADVSNKPFLGGRQQRHSLLRSCLYSRVIFYQARTCNLRGVAPPPQHPHGDHEC